MHHIESLITHFLGVSWGPVVPPGEACSLLACRRLAGRLVLQKNLPGRHPRLA